MSNTSFSSTGGFARERTGSTVGASCSSSSKAGGFDFALSGRGPSSSPANGNDGGGAGGGAGRGRGGGAGASPGGALTTNTAAHLEHFIFLPTDAAGTFSLVP